MPQPNRIAAAGQDGAFKDEVSAQAGKKLSADSAATLQGWGEDILNQIGT